VTAYAVEPVTGIGEVTVGTDLAAVVAERTRLRDGDVVVVTSKVVSKAEGRVLAADRQESLAAETDRVVARRGATSIVRTHHGLVMAAAGIDASNTAPGTVVLLPVDPDGSARRLRARLRELTGANVGVVVSDTSGRAWRIGQTDIAVGAAGLEVLVDHAGRTDPYGNPLVVTAPAVADELAGAGDLAKGKLAMAPVAVVRGLADLVLPVAEDGAGAAALVRPEAGDMFGLGAREAVLQAVLAGDRRGFGAAAGADELVAVLAATLGQDGRAAPGSDDDAPDWVHLELTGDDERAAGRAEARATAVAHAHGWEPVTLGSGVVTGFRPALP
jgi:coenzyme F420-0:L-glutamate ligase/coenzyme F420-1:gamma-L-glutamate ligase